MEGALPPVSEQRVHRFVQGLTEEERERIFVNLTVSSVSAIAHAAFRSIRNPPD